MATLKTRFQIVLALFLALTMGCASSQKKEDELKSEIETDYQMALGFFENGDTSQAIRYLSLVLANDPGHADANFLMGIIRTGRGQYNEAIKHYKTALETRPNFLNCKNNLGTVYMHLDQYDKAIEIYLELTKSSLYVSPWLAYSNLGWCYYKKGMFVEAIDETEMAVSIQPQFCVGYNNLGIFYHAIGQDEKAIENLEEAIEKCANYAQPYLHLGLIYESRNDRVKAYKNFSRCAELEPKTDLGKRCKSNAKIVR